MRPAELERMRDLEETHFWFRARRRELRPWLEEAFASAPAGPVLDLEQVFSDPQVLARNMLVELPHPELGTFRTTGLPVKLSATPGRIERRPPLHGEHTDEVLEECGVSLEEIERLRREEVL